MEFGGGRTDGGTALEEGGGCPARGAAVKGQLTAANEAAGRGQGALAGGG